MKESSFSSLVSKLFLDPDRGGGCSVDTQTKGEAAEEKKKKIFPIAALSRRGMRRERHADLPVKMGKSIDGRLLVFSGEEASRQTFFAFSSLGGERERGRVSFSSALSFPFSRQRHR